ncbi:MAG TPA: glycosyltransferase family 2 protein [Candidatus Limnocylindria bacterium]|nr:glycosyltransferase family 2 protein [Candidatus Limnocylindria bacterium]
MTGLAFVLFITAAAVTVWIYFGYPLLMWILASLRPRPVAKADVTPFATLVVPVYNEQDVVGRKIENSLSLDYPPDRLEILFISDGSTDRTVEIIRAAQRAEIRLLELPRSGKAAALNAGAEYARGEILVFTDANVDLEPRALRILARSFADPSVGGVSGRKKYIVRRGSDTTEVGENLYWRWDQWQKELESAAGSIFAADGTLYAIRRSLYVPIHDPAQADDIAISTRVVLQGFRLTIDPEAVAFEEAPAEGRDEFRRKVRVTNHSVRALLNLGPALWTSGFYSVELLSHKLVRHLIPFFLVVLIAATAWLARDAFAFRVLLLLQVAFYGLAVAGTLLRRRRLGSVRIFSIPYYFCLVNAAALFGVLSILRGRRVREWTPRST